MLTAMSAGYDSSVNFLFQFPDDSKYNSKKLIIISAHIYIIYDFAMKTDISLSEFT